MRIPNLVGALLANKGETQKPPGDLRQMLINFTGDAPKGEATLSSYVDALRKRLDEATGISYGLDGSASPKPETAPMRFLAREMGSKLYENIQLIHKICFPNDTPNGKRDESSFASEIIQPELRAGFAKIASPLVIAISKFAKELTAWMREHRDEDIPLESELATT